jgi:polyphosphate kinase
MIRNMEKRVEIVFPILELQMKKFITNLLYLVLTDNVKAREQNELGDYMYVEQTEDEPEIGGQMILFGMAYDESEEE